MKGFWLSKSLCCCFVVLAFSSCKPEIDPEGLGLGNLRFNQYVAIGDEYTAGYSNSGLYEASQEYAFPRIFSNQLNQIKFNQFNQPLVQGNGTGFMYLDELQDPLCQDGTPRAEIKFQGEESGWENPPAIAGPFHNLGIPNLNLEDAMFSASELENPFLDRVTGQDEDISYMEMIENGNGDFISIWFGLHEFLEYALMGAESPTAKIPRPEEFESAFKELLNTITSKENVHLIIFNIPEVSEFPYFQTVSHEYRDNNCQFLPIYIETENESGEQEIRIATKEDLILLPAREQIGGLDTSTGFQLGIDIEYPLDDSLVLDKRELERLRQITQEFNLIIKREIDYYRENYKPKVVFLDIHNFFRTSFQTGLVIDGLSVDHTYLTGGLFSIDGWSLSPRGNAVVAYRMIELVNNQYFAKLPLPVVADFEGVVFP